jgi:hypothetical protein
MAVTLPNGSWSFADLQNRYERAQSLANDCIQDFAGNYFFPSDRSPKGYWTTSRRQKLDYVCDCPDFARLIDQQMMNSAPSRWVRNDWSTNPDNRILVNRCIHCFAVAIAERELDPSFPINRIYSAKRERFPKTDCGCGCGGSGGCGCPSKELGLPPPKLIQGCDTDCYVEPLTPRTQRTPSTTEGVPAYQTFELPTIQFQDIEFKACAGKEITITLVRSTSQGFNNATVSGLLTDIEFPFEPEFKTSSKSVLLDISPGEYVIGISAIASGNFGEKTEAKLLVFDCDNQRSNRDFPYPPCEEQDFVEFGGGECEGSYEVGYRQTGNINPDGTCEQIKVLKFNEALDCPSPEPPPPKECESLEERDCSPIAPEPPKCVNTGSGDGFNSNAGFNAVFKVRTGNKDIEYLRPDKKECMEVCEFAEIAVFSPSCPEPPPKPVPPPFCPLPINRYIGWQTEADYLASAYVNGIGIHEAFSCDDGTVYVLVGRLARCLPPANRYVDSFEAATYDGNKFGEGCCPFNETKPPRPVCPVKPKPVPVDKWSCSGGVCSPDANGIYNSQAECEAALIPANFTGGQCPAPAAYRISFAYEDAGGTTWYQNGFASSQFATTNPAITGTPQGNYLGKITSVQAYVDPVYHPLLKAIFVNGVYNGLLAGQYTWYVVNNFRVYRIERVDGLPDNCGNPPPTCPP